LKTGEMLNKAKKYRGEAEELLKTFKQNFYDPSKVWDELMYCLCTPQTKAVNALKACEEVKKLNRGRVEEIASTLRRCGVRFHNNKARYIAEAKNHFPQLYEKIRVTSNLFELREFLVKNVKGMGYKEASHFLRNIGFENVAIIDRHIFRYMLENRLISPNFGKLTARKYLTAESRLIRHAKRLGLTPALLDLLVWAVSTGRVAK